MRPVLTIAVAFSISADCASQPHFRPGHLFLAEYGLEACFSQVNWIVEFDPDTGVATDFADYSDGLCTNNGLAFTPDGRRLRTLNYSSNNIMDFDPGGAGTVVLTGQDGLGGPSGRNGLTWDADGNFYVANAGLDQILKFPAGGGAAVVLADYDDGVRTGGALAVNPQGELFFAQFDLRDNVIYHVLRGGGLEVFDSAPVRSIVFDRQGNLFGGASTVYRYEGGRADARRILASFEGSESQALTISPDDRVVYLANTRHVYAIDAESGSTLTIYEFPLDPLGRPWRDRYGGAGIAVYDPPRRGDLNCNRRIDNLDIDPFVLALTDAPAYRQRFRHCDITLADLNGDGFIDNLDIDPFVAALLAGP